jgi:retron-type reverse transcriptase
MGQVQCYLLRQYLRRTVYDDGLYEDVTRGISLGCPLSPLMVALFLDVLDRRMEATGLCYVRFMDDWVVLAPTRLKLRSAVRIVNHSLEELQVLQHPDFAFVGRIAAGFEFLGYCFSNAGLVGVARATHAAVRGTCQPAL